MCVCARVCARQCDLWVRLLQLKQVSMWYCFLYSADIETLLLVSMKKTANENLFFLKIPLTLTLSTNVNNTARWIGP